MDVLTYHARNDAPLVTLLVPRRDAQRMTLDPRSLADREKRALDRASAMIAYCASTNHCRESHLLRYFGEPATQACGRCDRCMRRERAERKPVPGMDPTEIDLLRWEADQKARP